MRYLGLASLLALITIPTISRADETIIMDLPPSHAQTSTASTEPKFTPLPETTPRATKPSRSATSTAPDRRGGLRKGPKEKVVGRLGVVSTAATIRAARGSSKRALARVNGGTYLALIHDSGDWYGVLMADRSTGWIPKRYVNVLDYEVVGPDTPAAPRYASSSAPALDSQLLNGGQRTILEEAYKYLGVPYKWGGTSPNGMDCSAFVQRCFGVLGIRLPRTAHEQIACGIPISPDQLQPADRLYFASRSGAITHTGIYIGNGYFIHASSSRGGVAVSRLSEPLYRRMYAGARR